MLQRGRARAGAESITKADGQSFGTHASTGPRPRGRGERVETAGNPGRRIRFNGAAPARARRGFWFRNPGSAKLWLQRGRARAGAERT